MRGAGRSCSLRRWAAASTPRRLGAAGTASDQPAVCASDWPECARGPQRPHRRKIQGLLALITSLTFRTAKGSTATSTAPAQIAGDPLTRLQTKRELRARTVTLDSMRQRAKRRAAARHSRERPRMSVAPTQIAGVPNYASLGPSGSLERVRVMKIRVLELEHICPKC